MIQRRFKRLHFLKNAIKGQPSLQKAQFAVVVSQDVVTQCLRRLEGNLGCYVRVSVAIASWPKSEVENGVIYRFVLENIFSQVARNRSCRMVKDIFEIPNEAVRLVKRGGLLLVVEAREPQLIEQLFNLV